MKITIASVAGKTAGKAFDELAATYITRTAPYSELEPLTFRSEVALRQHIERTRGRTPPIVVLLDSRGKTFTSDDFAAWLGRQRDSGQQTLVFAVGPADGWSDDARDRAQLLLSLGPMTLPHELARVVLAEQLYRAFTILAGHPYHSGHTG